MQLYAGYPEGRPRKRTEADCFRIQGTVLGMWFGYSDH